MQKSIYREVLKKSWEIIKGNRLLWLFGLVAALLGTGGEFQILMTAFRGGSGIAAGKISPGGILGIHQLLVYSPLEFCLVLMAVFSVLFLVGFLIWAVIVSQASLISGIDKASGNKKFNFNESINLGIKKFSSLLAVNAVSEGMVYLLLLFCGIALSFYFKINSFLYETIYLILFLLLIPLALMISFSAKYAIAYAVIKNKDFIESVKSAVKLFFGNWIISLEMAAILCAVNIVVGIAAIFLLIMVSIPLSTVAYLYYAMSYYALACIMMFLMMVIDIAIIGFAGAFLAVFQWTNWIVLFKKLNSRETVLSKIERIILAFPAWRKVA